MKHFAFILLVASVALGQSISPPSAENGSNRKGITKGSYTVSNTGLTPMAVVIQPVSLSFDAQGHTTVSKLDEAVLSVRTSESSLKLGPQSSTIVDFEATCKTLPEKPCAFAIDNTMDTNFHTTEGLKIAVHLLTVEYVCRKENGCRKLVRQGFGITQ